MVPRFTFYKDSALQEITHQDLFSNRRILICSVARPWMHTPEDYSRYIISLKDQYRELGIDEIYLMPSAASGLFVIAKFEKNHPQIISLYDNDNAFVSLLREQQNKTNFTVNELSKYWSFQALVNNGEIEQFYEQPLEHYVRHIIKAGHRISLDTHKFFITEGDRFALDRATLMPFEQERKTPYGHIYYFNLWPNTKLEQYLIDTSNSSTV